MSMLEKYTNAIDKKDESTMNELLHDDFKFTMHKSGNTIGKADVIKWAMSGDINQDKARVVYENDEIGVHHSIVTFNDGNVEAVMAVYKYKDGKIISLETGATPMPKQVSQLLFICIAITALDIFLIIYALTIPLYPKKWRKEVNKKYKNETATGVTIIFVTMAACFLWVIYFYFLIFDL